MSTPRGPLAGIKIIDLTINVLGPMATQLLGDMGADVIKVETPTGDPMRTLGPGRSPGMAAHFLNFNRSKRSVTLNLKDGDDRAALMRLVETADVFVHNMRAAAAERLGIGPAAIQAVNPRIVYAYATGYRKDGPKRDRPAFDDVIQGESGLAGMIGQANGDARFVPYAMADKLCGVYLALGINAALVHAARGGSGQVVHVPMLETMVSFNLGDHLWTATLSDAPADAGYPRMFTPHRRPYPTSDGHICLLAVTDDQWHRLFGALDRADLREDARFRDMAGRTQHIDALYGLLAELMLTRTTTEWQARLDAADVPNGPLTMLSDLLGDPYLRATGFFSRYEHPSEGPLTTMAFPVDFSGAPGGMNRAPPRLGEQNAEVFGRAPTTTP